MLMRDPVSIASGTRSTIVRGPVVIYPMYDFAHPLQDSIEGITTLCAQSST